ncbi:TIGR01777 family oxidoreductase [Mucilaginibacter paludis]|uniref:NAD-dependent epimerase/dehydratase n=1 Tax=Mucilaginibacter paludis DSM 18603 TaxID=714943 RepID=H1XZR3_9SPHI|nr:TIGR01777 family oxidoreductase [Mucilaginibacter paludis]EHQ27755.1 protein of unknown function DUF1731 [Mucilaginibacter paludis DSM 18603]
MNKKVVLAGGTGFVGQFLAAQLRDSGYQVLIISRQPGHIQWQDDKAIMEALNNADMLINLAGKSVNCRYNDQNKAEIFSSRLQTTKILGEAILKCSNPPELWINSSTGTIYRHAEDRAMTESTGEIGGGFSVDVATQWEQMFFSFNTPRTRQVALRMAIVLGKAGGVMGPFKNLVKFGLGGKQGNGRQKFSWIHIKDVLNIILFIKNNSQLAGVVNCSSPNPVDNQKLMQTLRESMNMKFGLPSPVWLLKMGAVLIKTETELILKSRWVIPERLTAAGFQFEYPDIKSAITNLLK